MENWIYGSELPNVVEQKTKHMQMFFSVVVLREQTEYGWRWQCIDVPFTWNKGKLISSIVRLRYSVDDVEAILNNVFQDPFNEKRLEDYQALQQWREYAKSVEEEAREYALAQGLIESVEEEQEPSVEAENTPDGMTMLMQAVKLLKKQVVDLPDEDAADVPALFPAWVDFIGKEVEIGKRLFFGGRLWKVLQAHTCQENWPPDITPALFTEVVVQGEGEPEIGTLDNPIPYNGNMELEEGKYYTQDGVVYRCIRSSGAPVYHPLSALVGLYVEIVN